MTAAGKVFHTKAHKRQKNEKYYTPAWVTQALWRRLYLKLETCIWEPAAGDGQISNELTRLIAGEGWRVPVSSSDIDPDTPAITQQNFLTITNPASATCIITNPPFGTGGRLAFQFCWHALRLMEQRRGKVAMLMRDDYDSAGGRQALFRDHPAWAYKIVLTERVRWVNLPQSTEHGPSGAHAWYVWDWAREPGPATLHYEGR